MNPINLIDYIENAADLIREYEEKNTPMYNTLIKLIEAKKNRLNDDQFFNVTLWAACSILSEEHEALP